MAKTAKAYRRLSGGFLSGRRRELWLGADHLLATTSLYGFEKYRRFFLRDIRALVVRRTASGKVRAIILGSVSVALLITAYSMLRKGAPGGNPNAILCGCFTWIGIALIVVALLDLLRGATCIVYVQTVAGAERLDAPNRWRAALRMEAQLVPLILAAQQEEAAPA